MNNINFTLYSLRANNYKTKKLRKQNIKIKHGGVSFIS